MNAEKRAQREPAYSLMHVEKAFGGTVQSVAISGTMIYAAVGLRLAVIDASDVAQPKVIGQTTFSLAKLQDVLVWRNYVFGNSAGYLKVIDVTDPRQPTWRAAFENKLDERSLVVGDSLYLVRKLPTGNELTVLDFVALPTFKASAVWRFGEAGQKARFLATDGKWCLIYSSFQGFPSVLLRDVSKPARPRQVAHFDGYFDPVGAVVAGGQAFVVTVKLRENGDYD